MANSVERYYVKKKRRKKRAKMIFLGLLCVLMLLTMVILSVTVFFNAEHIHVEGNAQYTMEEILEAGGLKIGQNLFRLDKFEVIEGMETLPYVKEVTIKRKLPHTLKVTVVENEPVAWIPAQGGAALLNEEYRVLEIIPLEVDEEGNEIKPEGIPLLSGAEATLGEVGQSLTFGEEDYTGFLARLYEGFNENPDLEWSMIDEIFFHARYDVQVQYRTLLTIDFGTLDQTSTKLKLAAYLINDNGTTQAAVIDVTDTERVYYRPKK